MTKTHKLRPHESHNQSFKGGKVIGSGGFGCIFDPPLKCKNKKRGTNLTKQQITKLMKKKYTTKEYTEVQKFYRLLKDIPNFSHYYLVDDFSTCVPDELTQTDLKDFNKKCGALKKMQITASNINESINLNKLLALNMPYGGADVSKFIKENLHNASKMIELNNSLCKLLEYGIIPMNKRGVYHCDLKSANILVREEDGVLYTRIIDWGLSTSYKEGETIPKVLSNRPFQYNVPFSNVIFTTLFTSMYKDFLKTNKNADFYTVRTFVINYILEWIEKRGPGHLKTMNTIIKSLFEKDLKDVEESFKRELIEYDYTFYFIFEYITKILVKFTRDGEFDKMSYFNEVFLHNIDLWGLVTSYIPIIEGIINTNKKATPTTNSILNKVKQLILVVIDADDHPINVSELLDKLKALNDVFVHLQKSDVKGDKSSSDSTTISTDSIIEELNTDEKKEVGSSSVHTETRKKVKKRKFHKMIIKTLKNIKSLHSKKAWM